MFTAARLKTHEGVRIMLSCDSNLHKQDDVPMTCWLVRVAKLIASWRHQHGLARMLSVCLFPALLDLESSFWDVCAFLDFLSPGCRRLRTLWTTMGICQGQKWTESRYVLVLTVQPAMWSNLARGVTTTQESYNCYEVTTVAEEPLFSAFLMNLCCFFVEQKTVSGCSSNMLTGAKRLYRGAIWCYYSALALCPLESQKEL